MKHHERRDKCRFNVEGSKITTHSSPRGAELDACLRGSQSLADQLSVMRRFYDRASEKTHALRQALKNCRNCLRERDQQLDVANRVIEKLAGERATLQGKASTDQNTIEQLQSSIMQAKPHIQLSQKHRQAVAELSERANTAEACSRAANAVLEKYETEIGMLRAALDVHVKEFEDGSNVQSSLILSVAKVREENVHLALQLAQSQRTARNLEQGYVCMQNELKWLQDQKRAAEVEALRVQTAFVDASKQFDLLTVDHDTITCELREQKTIVQDLKSAGRDTESHMGSLQAKVRQLEQALATSDMTTQAECQSVDARWQVRLDGRVAELLAVQKALESQLESMHSRMKETSTELKMSVNQLDEEKRAHVADAVHWKSQSVAQRQRSREAFAKVAIQQSLLQGKDNEIKMLHDQVNDVTGVNHQLQLELEESHVAIAKVKDELFVSVQNLVSKECELQQVMKEAENATEALRREYGNSCDRIRILEAEASQIKHKMSAHVTSSHQMGSSQPLSVIRSFDSRGDASSDHMLALASTPIAQHDFLEADHMLKPYKNACLMLSTPAAQHNSNPVAAAHRSTHSPLHSSSHRAAAAPDSSTRPVGARRSSNGKTCQHDIARPRKWAVNSKSTPDVPLCANGQLGSMEPSDLFSRDQHGDLHSPENDSENAAAFSICTAQTQLRPVGLGRAAACSIGNDSGSMLAGTGCRSLNPVADQSRHGMDSVGIQFNIPSRDDFREQSSDACRQHVASPPGSNHVHEIAKHAYDDQAGAGKSVEAGNDNAYPLQVPDYNPGEVARWEERLKSSQDRLDVMRMERAQWHAMVQAAETQTHLGKQSKTAHLRKGDVPASSDECQHGLTVDLPQDSSSALECGHSAQSMQGWVQCAQMAHHRPSHPSELQHSDGQALTPNLNSLNQQLLLHHRHRRLHDSGRTSHRSCSPARGTLETQCCGLSRPSPMPTDSLTDHATGFSEVATSCRPFSGPENASRKAKDDPLQLNVGAVRSPSEAHCHHAPTVTSIRHISYSNEDATPRSVQDVHMELEGKRSCTSRVREGRKANGCDTTSRMHSLAVNDGSSSSGRCESATNAHSQVSNATDHDESCRRHGEVQWTKHVHHSVTGALDEAMGALEAELGYRPPTKKAHGRNQRDSSADLRNARVISPCLSDLASMDVGAEFRLFNPAD